MPSKTSWTSSAPCVLSVHSAHVAPDRQSSCSFLLAALPTRPPLANRMLKTWPSRGCSSLLNGPWHLDFEAMALRGAPRMRVGMLGGRRGRSTRRGGFLIVPRRAARIAGTAWEFAACDWKSARLAQERSFEECSGRCPRGGFHAGLCILSNMRAEFGEALKRAAAARRCLGDAETSQSMFLEMQRGTMAMARGRVDEASNHYARLHGMATPAPDDAPPRAKQQQGDRPRVRHLRIGGALPRRSPVRRLGVRGRSAALERARELGLVDARAD